MRLYHCKCNISSIQTGGKFANAILRATRATVKLLECINAHICLDKNCKCQGFVALVSNHVLGHLEFWVYCQNPNTKLVSIPSRETRHWRREQHGPLLGRPSHAWSVSFHAQLGYGRPNTTRGMAQVASCHSWAGPHAHPSFLYIYLSIFI